MSLRARAEFQPFEFAVLRDAGQLERSAATLAGQRSLYFATVGKNTRALSRLAQILDEAERAGLPLLPYKGALFAEVLYQDLGARPMVDMDLLVARRDLEAAAALLGRLGFVRQYEGVRFSSRHGHDWAFADEEGLWVELHYRLFHEFACDAAVEPLFERTIAVELSGRRRQAPSWPDHLFATAVHAASHAFRDSPLWLFDLALLVERVDDLEAVAREAERRRAHAPFYFALFTAHRLLPSLVPCPQRSPSRVALRAALLQLALTADLFGNFSQREAQLRSLLARAVLTDRPRDALREILRKVELRIVERFER